MAKLHSPFIKGVTEKYDEIYSISQLQYDEDNYKLYLDNDDEYFTSLVKSIKDNGLRNPIIIYSDWTIKSGHTRVKACKELEFDGIPVNYTITNKPQTTFDNMMALQMENQTRSSDIGRQYNQIKVTADAYRDKNGTKCPPSIIKDVLCPAAQMSWNMFHQLRELEDGLVIDGIQKKGRPDLLKRVLDSNGSKLSPGKAH